MTDDVSDIKSFYDNNVDLEDARLERHQLERDVTLRFFEDYIPPGARVLEVGAATGTYTKWLAARGHSVTAVNFSENLLAKCKEQLASAGFQENVSFHIVDARDLSGIPENSFDVVLLMGPLYHLILKDDRHKALQEAFARLKPGGLIFSAWISRYGILGELLAKCPDWIEKQNAVHSILTRGRDPENWPRGGFRGYFCTVSELAPQHETVGFEKVVLAGVEPGISADDASYNRLQGKQRQLWLDLFYEVSTEESLVASSRHLLFIGRKPM